MVHCVASLWESLNIEWYQSAAAGSFFVEISSY